MPLVGMTYGPRRTPRTSCAIQMGMTYRLGCNEAATKWVIFTFEAQRIQHQTPSPPSFLYINAHVQQLCSTCSSRTGCLARQTGVDSSKGLVHVHVGWLGFSDTIAPQWCYAGVEMGMTYRLDLIKPCRCRRNIWPQTTLLVPSSSVLCCRLHLPPAVSCYPTSPSPDLFSRCSSVVLFRCGRVASTGVLVWRSNTGIASVLGVSQAKSTFFVVSGSALVWPIGWGCIRLGRRSFDRGANDMSNHHGYTRQLHAAASLRHAADTLLIVDGAVNHAWRKETDTRRARSLVKWATMSTIAPDAEPMRAKRP